MLPTRARASPKVLRMGEGKRRCTGLRSTTRSVAGGFAAGIGGNEFGYGVAFDLLKTAWIVLAAVYLYDISVETGQFVNDEGIGRRNHPGPAPSGASGGVPLRRVHRTAMTLTCWKLAWHIAGSAFPCSSPADSARYE